ncbi:MAG: YitT family protein [Clostridia bacterium]|nr:YitT family protein [Clostridia bacterium]
MSFRKTKPYVYFVIVLSAIVMAVNYEIFVFPNSFAPAGLNGLATMVQKLFNFSMGYLSLILNIPLCIVLFLIGNRMMAVRSSVFVIVFSLTLLVFSNGWIDLSQFIYHTDNGTSTILAPVAAGVVNGLICGTIFSRNCGAGGTDSIGAIVRHFHPETNMVWVIFVLNSFVAVLSYFVYDFKFEPVIMCIIYSFITSRVGDLILKGLKRQMKFEIVSNDAEKMSKEIIKELRHTATLVHAKGMFSGEEKDMLICVVQRHQIVQLQKIISKYPGSFAYMHEVNETYGNFKQIPRLHVEHHLIKGKGEKTQSQK